MIEIDDLDKMPLPLNNPNEELEIMSEQRLKLLFSPLNFHFCSRDERDKGVDLVYEIKRKGKHLGFRFVIQLKATATISANKTDGSFSKSIDTSNINYLLNNNSPAFYILYDKKNNQFFFEHLNRFVGELYKENVEWQQKQSHTLRFSKRLTEESIIEIYDTVLRTGLLQRQQLDRTLYIANSLTASDRISVGVDMTVTDDTQIREKVEAHGMAWVSSGMAKEILTLHKNATGHVASTSLYNMIVGIANYYAGSRLEALSFLTKARKRLTDLKEELRPYLCYFDATVRFALAMITEDEYLAELGKVGERSVLGLYIKLENARRNYLSLIQGQSKDDLKTYGLEVETIIKDPLANPSLILFAKCDLVLYKGFHDNHNFFREASLVNARLVSGNITPKQVAGIEEKLALTLQKWWEFVNGALSAARAQNNHFAYHAILVNKSKVFYQYLVCRSAIRMPRISGNLKPAPEDILALSPILRELEKAGQYFNTIGHAENQLVAFCSRYEIYHYLEKGDEAGQMLKEAAAIIEQFDLEDLRSKFESLQQDGTVHQKMAFTLAATFDKHEALEAEIKRMKEEMSHLDETEKRIVKSTAGMYVIQLFPVGFFQFPKSQKLKAYEILGIAGAVAKNFDELLEFMSPIANIFYHPILSEGPRDGFEADRSIENRRNLYRARKAFFKHGFHKL